MTVMSKDIIIEGNKGYKVRISEAAVGAGNLLVKELPPDQLDAVLANIKS